MPDHNVTNPNLPWNKKTDPRTLPGLGWGDQLRDFAATQRAIHSIPPRDSLSPLQEAVCRVIGGHFLTWCARNYGELLRGRQVFSRVRPTSHTPLSVFLTDEAGLVALEEITASWPTEVQAQLIFLRRAQWLAFPGFRSDELFQHHIETWSYFEPYLPSQRTEEEILDPEEQQEIRNLATARLAKKFPLVSPENCWLHQVGYLWSELAGSSVGHLWLWNGEELSMLEQEFDRAIY